MAPQSPNEGNLLVLGGRTHPAGQAVRAALSDELRAAYGPDVVTTPDMTALRIGPKVVEVHGLSSLIPSPAPESLQVHQAMLARAAGVRRLVLILPASPLDWWSYGVLWASKPHGSLRLALLVAPHELEHEERFPIAIAAAELVTSDPRLVVAWIGGSLFAGILPKKPPAPRSAHRMNGHTSPLVEDH